MDLNNIPMGNQKSVPGEGRSSMGSSVGGGAAGGDGGGGASGSHRREEAYLNGKRSGKKNEQKQQKQKGNSHQKHNGSVGGAGGGGLKFSSSVSVAPSNLPSASSITAANGAKPGTAFISRSDRIQSCIDKVCSDTSPPPVRVLRLKSIRKSTDQHYQPSGAYPVSNLMHMGKDANSVPANHVGDVAQSLGSLSVNGLGVSSSSKTSSAMPKGFLDLTDGYLDKSPTLTPTVVTATKLVTKIIKENPKTLVAPIKSLGTTKTVIMSAYPSTSGTAPDSSPSPDSAISSSHSVTDEDEATAGAARLTLKNRLDAYRLEQEAKVAQQVKEQEQEKAKINKPISKPLFNRNRVPRAILEQTQQLPIYSRKAELIELVQKHQFVIVIGETGSGKSTQIPQYLVEAGLHGSGKIGVTQPRRVAAKSLADRVAKECGVNIGTSVGYAVRFDKQLSGDTAIKYMTDGLLVKECTTEATLDSYSVIIIDEAHERSIHTDVCFGLLKRAAKRRPDLKVIISSATLEEAKFSTYFNNAPIFNVSGKGFPVDIVYNPKSEYDYMQGAVDTIVNINKREPPGDILVFLSGQDEIEQVWDLVDLKMREVATSLDLDLWIVPCYGGLPFDDQQKIFEETPKNMRKVVLATNIAETSLTIDGIVYVVDCGYFKQNEYNPKSGISSLVKRQITTFQAIQRKGRAGRTKPGKCYRLYPESDFKYRMKKATQPEITRCNVESVILDIISMGIPNPLEFEFMDRPPNEAMLEAIEHLRELSALDGDMALTTLGRRMSEFPLDPPLAKVVIESEKLGCSAQVLKIVALLSTQYQNLFSRSKRDRQMSDKCKAKFDQMDGDMLTLLKIYDAWVVNGYDENWCRSQYIQYRHLAEAEEIRVQLKDILHSRGIAYGYQRGMECDAYRVSENVRRAFTAGFFRQLAKKKITGHAYQNLGDLGNIEDVYLHPSSSLFNYKHPWVIYHEVMKTTKAYMRGVISIEPRWISEYAPEFSRKLVRHGIIL